MHDSFRKNPRRVVGIIVFASLTALLWGVSGAAVSAQDEAAAPSPPTLTELADAIDGARLGAEIDHQGPIRLLGGGVLTPSGGASVRHLMAGDRPCGVVVKGNATLTYTVADRYSVPIARRNLAAATKLPVQELEAGLEVTEAVESAIVWSFDLGLPAPDGAGAGEPLPEWAAEIISSELVRLPSTTLLAGRGLGVAGGLYGLFRGDKETLRIVRDPVEQAIETLSRVDQDDLSINPLYKRKHYVQRLAAEPVGREWWQRFPAGLVTIATKLEVENLDGEEVTVRTTADVQASRDGVSVWVVDLVSELAGDRKWLPVDVLSVRVDGKEADFHHRDDRLMVQLPAALPRLAKARIEVEHRGDFAVRPGGDNFWSLGTWAWYPQPLLNGELSTFEISVKVPAKLTPFASGQIVERKEEGDFQILRTRLENPMQFPVVAAGNYTVYSETKDGITCHVATYGTGKKKGAERLITNFFAAADYYTSLYDVPYPFTEFTIVEVNSWGFGQAPPGLIFITKEALNSTASAAGRFFSEGLNERYVHEVAHAWWGHVVKMDSREEQWVTESFASYSAAMCLEKMYGGKKGERAFRNIMKNAYDGTKNIEDGSIYLANYIVGEDAQDRIDRYQLLYEKGPVVIQAIRERLNKEKGSEQEGFRNFVAFLRTFLKTFKYQWGPTNQMQALLEQITGTSWAQFFDDYVYGTKIPEIDVE